MRPVLHQCSLVGCRIGEASNPGPVQTRSGRVMMRARGQSSQGRFEVLSSQSGEEARRERVTRNKRLRLSQATTVEAVHRSVVEALEEG